MVPEGPLSILYRFQGSVDGNHPAGGLVQATDGNLYGATSLGGSGYYGTVFQISPGGAFKHLYSFEGPTGYLPQSSLIQYTNGMLYGTVQTGGANAYGAVYSLDLGLGPFVTFVRSAGPVGQIVQILGQHLTGSSGVTFNGVAATTFKVVGDTYMTAVVPVGATTGPLVVTTPNGALTSNINFRVTP